MDNTTPLTALSHATRLLQVLADAAQSRTLRPGGAAVDDLFNEALAALYDAECRTRSLATSLTLFAQKKEAQECERKRVAETEALALQDAVRFLELFDLEKEVDKKVGLKLKKQEEEKLQRQQQQQQQQHQQQQLNHVKEKKAQEEEQLASDETHDSTTAQPILDPCEQPPQPAPPKKMNLAISLLSDEEFDALPKYLLNRLTLEKINASLAEFNKLVAAKYATLKIPHAKMNKLQRDRFWEHKKSCNEATKGKSFLMEREIKDAWWSSGAVNGRPDKNGLGLGFKLDPLGRNVLALARHLGRIKEVRGGGDTRIVIL
ncbi:hypothetical protein BDR26DRAFT_869783 [Obelidium mucronatum]|nr:hypothetical protein BDR26DRAFT_869783 [Obelidium mucronatum]